MAEIARRNVYMERLGYAAAGLVVGALLTFGAVKFLSAVFSDGFDEQPPIIVKGGSLEFTWDDEWKSEESGAWERRMPKGVSPGQFEVVFEPSTCQTVTVPWFHVLYDPDDNGPAAEETFEVTFVPRQGQHGQGKRPAVKGPNLVPVNPNTLRREGTSTIIIRAVGPGGQELCKQPTLITARPKN